MKISKYLKEKFYLIILAIIISFIYTLFLHVTRVQDEVIIVIQFLFWTLVFAVLIIEYLRRASYYRNLNEALDSLDKKFLVTDIITDPDFMDGKILYHTLQIINKSMNDYVNLYRNSQQEYKEYIEMWVHEIKTPLAASKLIISNNQSDITKSIDEEIEKVEGYVDQALFYARSSTPEKDYVVKKMMLSNSVNQVIRKNAKVFILKNIRIELEQLDTYVYSDGKWLEFILDQIINNALKYTENGGTIKITSHKENKSIRLYIKDDGCGINSHDVTRVFDKGFTGRNGRTHEKATGMGLYLCKKLCDKLYLSLDIESKEGEGTTIIITFPLSDHMLMNGKS